MSIVVRIKQTSLFKKKLPFDVILDEDMDYGVYDEAGSSFFAYFLNCYKIPEDSCTIFSRKYNGRGIQAFWGNTGRRQNISLLLQLPTVDDDIIALFKMVKRIADFWKCEILLDDKPINKEDINKDLITKYLDLNEESLEEICNYIISGNEDNAYFPCLVYPLLIGKEEAKQFLNSMEAFYNWINDNQDFENYYATPLYTVNNDTNSLTGRYTVFSDTVSIFPTIPKPPYFLDDPKLKECDKYVLNYGLETDKTYKYEVNYVNFIDNIPDEKKKMFDEEHIIFKLSNEEIESILKSI